MASKKAVSMDQNATAKPKSPQRVKLVNKNKMNGALGATATPLEKDKDAWTAKGWEVAD